MYDETSPYADGAPILPNPGGCANCRLYLGAFGSFFWLDAIYGVGVAYRLSKLVVHWLA